MEKVDIKLNGIPQTLLLPLWGRAVFSHKPFSPIHDALAIQLTKHLNYDFDNLSKKVGNMTLFWVARAFYFDQAIKSFLRKNPDAVIVNLGAGLETTFYRVDNRKLQWVDIDLPDVIELRKKLLPPNHRVHTIAKSLFDYSWLTDIEKLGSKFFFFAGGVFMYFDEKEIKALLQMMSKHLPGSHLLFDAISEKTLHTSNKILQKANITDAKLQWSLQNYKELEKWSEHIKVISQSSIFHKLKSRYDFPLTLQIKMFLSDAFHRRKIIHLLFLEKSSLSKSYDEPGNEHS